MPLIKHYIICLRQFIIDFLYPLYDPIEYVKRIELHGARYYLTLGKEFDDYVFGERNSKRLKIIFILQLICLLNCLRIIIAFFVDNQTVRILLMDLTLELSHRMGASLFLIIFCVSAIIMNAVLLYQEYYRKLPVLEIAYMIKRNLIPYPLSDGPAKRSRLINNLLSIILLDYLFYILVAFEIIVHFLFTIQIYLDYSSITPVFFIIP